MKANELMIGDILKWKEQPGFNDEDRNMVLRVKRIYDDSIKIDGRFELYHISLFEPIPLVPEILEKNGFEVQDQGGGRKDVWTGFGIDCEGDIEVEFQNNIPVYLKIDGRFKGEYYTSANIKYLHELQRALRLLKTNKDIVL